MTTSLQETHTDLDLLLRAFTPITSAKTLDRLLLVTIGRAVAELLADRIEQKKADGDLQPVWVSTSEERCIL
jgi:hypothetical protein